MYPCINRNARPNNNQLITYYQTCQLLLKKLNMCSVNQINAQVKLTEMWKASKVENCPIKLIKKT